MTDVDLTPLTRREARIIDMLHERLQLRGKLSATSPGQRARFYHHWDGRGIACWFIPTTTSAGHIRILLQSDSGVGPFIEVEPIFDAGLSDLQIVHGAISQLARAEAEHERKYHAVQH